MNPQTGTPLFNWLTQRSAGILLHPSSLPGNQGIGTLEAAQVTRFLDFMSSAGLKQWQVCPLGPTGYGDSPYQCFSAFAGNPYLVDLKALVNNGLLADADLHQLAGLSQETCDYGALWLQKWPLLFKAHAAAAARKFASLPYGDFAQFQKQHASWLQAYAFFRALKDHFDGAPWWLWPAEQRNYSQAQSSALRKKLAKATEAHAFFQYLFFGQWQALRQAAAARGIEIVGDIPIFVALDSADAWSAPQLFEIDEKTGLPLAVAGVPPDYFSADGQLWGNPLYRWDAHAADGFSWWRSRLSSAFAQADIVRIDHFRGFDEYWSIPAGSTTARTGTWKPGPGLGLFKKLQESLPSTRIIAEDLGDIGPSVHALREATGLPGMAILQFAFGAKSSNLYLPHNHTANTVVYPGTHDNDTTLGWYASSPEKVRDHARRYLRVSGSDIGSDLIRSAYGSVARMCIVPLQDILSLGATARLNTPGAAQGNWRWRCSGEQLARLSPGTAGYLLELAELTSRSGAK